MRERSASADLPASCPAGRKGSVAVYVTRHASERLAERFTREEVAAIVERAASRAERGRKLAVLVERLSTARATGTDRYGDRQSNGDLVLAIVDWADPEPVLVTVMYRRSGQPLDARRLDCHAVRYAC